MTRIIEGFLEMPQHRQVMLNTFLEKALAGDEETNQLSEDYNAGRKTKEDLREELHRCYGDKEPG